MSRKIRLPDEDIEPIWDKMEKGEQEWYEEFKKATEYYNWKSLKYLCEIAPSDQYDQLFTELNYESHAMERARYTTPKSRHPKYSEHDYGWVQPKSVNIRREIQYDYSGNAQLTEFTLQNSGSRSRRKRS